MEHVSTTPAATAALGARLAARLRPGAVVALTGELGAGKTCFVQGLVEALGAPTRATSPTFVLINEYRGRLAVHHVDLYRVDRPEEAMDLGLDELFAGEGVTVVEWAEKLGPWLPVDAIRIHIDGVGDEPRRITVQGVEL